MRLLARLAPLLAALAGCPVEPPPCPGDAQGTLNFGGAVTSSDCALLPVQASTSFPATVSFLSDTQAAVCLSRPLTEPRLCTRSGDALGGCTSAPQEIQILPACPCPIDLSETLSGSLARTGARVSGFAGELAVGLARSTTAAAAACYATGDAQGTTAQCPPAGGCSARYAVEGTP